MINKIIKFISKMSMRRLITMLLTLLFVYMSVKGKIDSEQVTAIYGVIIGFYFGKSTALDVPSNDKKYTKEVED